MDIESRSLTTCGVTPDGREILLGLVARIRQTPAISYHEGSTTVVGRARRSQRSPIRSTGTTEAAKASSVGMTGVRVSAAFHPNQSYRTTFNT
jgi:hypothetical protein